MKIRHFGSIFASATCLVLGFAVPASADSTNLSAGTTEVSCQAGLNTKSLYVPENVYEINFEMDGARGGSELGAAGGRGAHVKGIMKVAPGERLTLVAGCSGELGSARWGQGGDGGRQGDHMSTTGASGGGASAVLLGNYYVPAAVAGGGGGAGGAGGRSGNVHNGGDGGSAGAVSQDGSAATFGNALGGKAGAAPSNVGSKGGNNTLGGGGGGGGGGYQGGVGGQPGDHSAHPGGGGGAGTSFLSDRATGVVTTSSLEKIGSVKISWWSCRGSC
ncbi:glycine-rich protein [Streptomyces erythrochromogenes]|uniref:glycine-rich protein n=2 Tax=Streptomyces erythrochromogenes TaxID=285574 RepID=UPI00367ACD5A